MGFIRKWKAKRRLSSSDPHDRLDAIFELAELGAPVSVEALEPMLIDANPDVVQTAAWYVAKLRTAAGISALHKAVRSILAERASPCKPGQDERKENVRLDLLMRAMAEYRAVDPSTGTLGPLWLTILRNRPHELRAGRFLHDGTAIAQVVSRLSQEGGVDATSLFVGLLADPVDEIRGAAVSALGNLRAPAAFEPLLELVRKMDSMADAACWALSMFDNAKVIPALEKIYRETGSSIVSKHLLTLGWVPGTSSEALKLALENENVAVLAREGGDGLRGLLSLLWQEYGIHHAESNDAQGMANQLKNIMQRTRSAEKLPDVSSLQHLVNAMQTAMRDGKAHCKINDLKMVAAMPDLIGREHFGTGRQWDDEPTPYGTPDYSKDAITCAQLRRIASDLLSRQ